MQNLSSKPATHPRTSTPWRWLVVAALLWVVGCAQPQQNHDQGLVVVATTTMLADLTRQLAPVGVRVEGLLPVGTDPHRYQPVPSDARRVSEARLVVTNGLGLEGWIGDLVRNANPNAAVVEAGDAVEALGPVGAPDPHFWLDPTQWRAAALQIKLALAALPLNDAQQAELEARHIAVRARIAALDEWIRTQLDSIPAEQRVLVTSHDAFGYFARAYTFDVHGIQGLSTAQEASQRDVAETITLVRQRNVRAVYVESAVPGGLVEQVARETGAQVLGPLFTDSLGDASSGASTWEGMLVQNVRLLVEGLGGAYTAPGVMPRPGDGLPQALGALP